MIILEPITEQNAIVFKNVRLRALQDTPSAFGSTYAKESQLSDEDWVKRAAQWTSERSVAYIAMDTGTPCGIAGGFLNEEDVTQGHLVSMWVAPSHRRQRVGHFLVTAIIDWAKTRGADMLLLMVTSNNASAVKFYEHLGFVMTGRSEPYPNDLALIEHEMSRTI